MALRRAWSIGGTTSEDGAIVVPGFGEMLVDQIRPSHVEAWRVGVGRLIQAGHYSPNTANSWFAVLRGVLRGAKRDFDLAGVASDGMKDFDTRRRMPRTPRRSRTRSRLTRCRRSYKS